MRDGATHWSSRLPFFFGWVIVAIAFVTMAFSVTSRTAFSLLLPPLLEEFGWDRGLAAGAFSFGFLVTAGLSPFIGRLMDRRGPRFVIECGVVLLAGGLFAATFIRSPWQLYATLGLMVGLGANLMSFSAQSLYLPNWFSRRRALAIATAFSGVGVGAILLLPLLQTIIVEDGWRAACRWMSVAVLVVIGPLNLLVRKRPQDIGLAPDGDSAQDGGARRSFHIADPQWAAVDWTLRRAMATARFWWVALGFFGAVFAWYLVQVHQTKYLIEIGFSPIVAAWALGAVGMIGVPGQIALGAWSDRVGREWLWTISCAGFAVCYAALIAMEHAPSNALLALMVISQGFFGYALTAVMGPIVAEIYEGRHYGAIFGTLNIALMVGGAMGPWAAGAIHDATGSYRLAFVIAIVLCVISAAAMWIAAPRKVRVVPGRRR